MAKLNIESPEIESSGVLDEDSFGIGNVGFILSLLRNKIYSNIKRAIVREYSCNARDAHREIGKDDVPIEITIPTFLDPNLRIRDFGPGISPTRIKEIFIKYGNSTKRNSDVQVGTYGIGAKSSFGYSDSFIINTFIDGIHRSYNAIIDESRCGKLVLLSEESTIAKTGTEIVIPIRSNDFSEFIKEIHHITKWWDVKPVIKGGGVVFENNVTVLSGTDWYINKGSNHYGNRELFLIVDGIEYTFDFSCVPIRFNYGVSLYLKFKTGEISVSANREQVEIDDKNKFAITKKLQVLEKEIDKKVEESISGASTFIEANCQFDELSKIFDRFDNCMWKGIKLFGAATTLTHGEIVRYDRVIGCNLVKKQKHYSSHTLPINKESIYCVMQQMLPFDARAQNFAIKLLEKFPSKTCVILMKFSDLKEITDKRLDLLELVQSEDYYKPKSKKASLGRLTFFVLGKGTTGFQRTSFDKFEEDTKKKVWIHLKKSNQQYSSAQTYIPLHKGIEIDINGLSKYSDCKMGDYSIYGFCDNVPKDKLEDAVEEIQSFDDYLDNDLKTSQIDPGEVLFACSTAAHHQTLFDDEEIKMIAKTNLLKYKNSPMISYLEEAVKFITKRKSLLVYQVFVERNTPHSSFLKELKIMVKVLRNHYPLLKYFANKENAQDYYYCRNRDCEIIDEDLFDYINLIDTTFEKSKKNP